MHRHRHRLLHDSFAPSLRAGLRRASRAGQCLRGTFAGSVLGERLENLRTRSCLLRVVVVDAQTCVFFLRSHGGREPRQSCAKGLSRLTLHENIWRSGLEVREGEFRSRRTLARAETALGLAASSAGPRSGSLSLASRREVCWRKRPFVARRSSGSDRLAGFEAPAGGATGESMAVFSAGSRRRSSS